MKGTQVHVVLLSAVLIGILLVGCGGAPAPTAVSTQGAQSTAAGPTAVASAVTPTKAPWTATSVPPTPTQAAPKVGGTLVYVLPGEPDTLDNQKSIYSMQAAVSAQVGACLLTKEPTEGKIVPYLAEKWTVSKDGLVWEFTLKKGIKFHDGTPCTAKDYVYTLRRALDPATMSTSTAAALRGAKSIELIDDYTFRLTLDTPSPALLQSLTQTPFFMPLSQAYVEKMGEQYGRAPMSVGPFKFKEWRTGEKIVLERNPDFAWGPDYSRGGASYIQTIEFRIVPESATVIAGLEAGEFDFAAIEAKDVARLEATGEFASLALLAQGVTPVVVFNVTQAPFTDVRVRQAFNLAVDRPGMIKTVALGRAIVQYGPISMSVPGYWPGVEKIGYGLDLERARSLMKEAGYTLNSAGVWEKDGAPLRLTLSASSSFPERAKMAEVLQAQLKTFGVQVEIVQKENAALNEDYRAGKHQFGVTSMEYPDVALMDVMYHSNFVGSLNFCMVNDPETDKLLDAMMASPTQEEYFAQAQKVQQYVIEKAYIIPVYTPKSVSVLRNTVKGYTWSEVTAQLDLFDAYITK